MLPLAADVATAAGPAIPADAATAGPATPPAAEGPPVDAAPSPLDELRGEYAQTVQKKRLFKRLPSRNERLAAEYKPLPLADAKKAIENESDPSMLVSALKGIWIFDEAHELANERGLVPLGAWAGKPQLDPLGFDKRLTDLIEIKFGTAAEIALTLFEGNDLALAAQAGELGEWSVKTKRIDLQDFPII